ncbi:MAG: hypothetical protein ACRCVN_06245 [Spirochaetia bacterium]
MIQIHSNIHIGNDTDCKETQSKIDWAIIHACQSCHKQKLAYEGALTENHPHYCFYEEDNHLYLNFFKRAHIDGSFMDPIILKSWEFINRHARSKNTLIHCNRGGSGSVTIALLYLGKIGTIGPTYLEAVAQLKTIYPPYNPNPAMQEYARENWDRLMHG